MDRRIIIVEGDHSFVNTAIEVKLKEAGFTIFVLPDDTEKIASHRYMADVVLYFPGGTSARIDDTMRYLTSLCAADCKTLCLIGDSVYINRAKKSEGGEIVHAEYSRPVNISDLVEDMIKLAENASEYSIEKTILIIDSSSEFLETMKGRLRDSYRVDGICSVKEALHYLDKKRPDLVLLDYEISEYDVRTLMDRIRSNPHAHKIPIVFLTEKNDKESIVQIIKLKPDGYLLKSMPKEELLSNLGKFFTQSLKDSD